MQRVDEMTEAPVVGQTYLVPVHQDRVGRLYPIMGPFHSDAELAPWAGPAAALPHAHYDVRFLPLAMISKRQRQRMDRATALFSHVHLLLNDPVPPEGVLFHSPLVCLRKVPTHPFDVVWREQQVVAGYIPFLEARYATARVKCGRCPHRGRPCAGDRADHYDGGAPMTADDLRALLRCDRDAKEARAEWERQRAAQLVRMAPYPGCPGELTPREQAMLGLLRAVAVCFRDGDGFYRDDACQFCGADIGHTPSGTFHRTGCVAPVLEVLRG